MQSSGYGGRGSLNYGNSDHFLRGLLTNDHRQYKPKDKRGKGPLIITCGICGLHMIPYRDDEEICRCDFEGPQGWRQTPKGGWR